ncbi:zinc knuckle CX2CX4HX4C containing protein, partial [Tanacetum coccineum]
VNVWHIQLLRTMSRILGVNGLVKSMMTTKCLFFFKFSSKDGTNSMIENDDAMIENDAWLIPTVELLRAMVELRADIKLKDTLVVAIPKFVGEGYNMSTIRVEYEWTPLRCSSCKVFGHVLDYCPKKIVSDVLKNLKNPRQAVRGI